MGETPDTRQAKYVILKEQFWFTATALAVNGFLLSHDTTDNRLRWLFLFGSLVVSLCAIYLVLHRYAEYVKQNSDKLEANDTKKPTKTRSKLSMAARVFIPAIVEGSGTFFHMILIALSATAICLKFMQPLWTLMTAIYLAGVISGMIISVIAGVSELSSEPE